MADKTEKEFKGGGFCKLSATTVAKIPMTPVALLKAGWPNKFLILEVYDDEKKGELLRLDPCCGWMVDPKDEEKHACEAHPAKYFEPLPGHIQDQPKDEDEEAAASEEEARYSGFSQEEDGEDAVGVEYVPNGKDGASFFIRRAGQRPLVLRGAVAGRLHRTMKKLGVF